MRLFLRNSILALGAGYIVSAAAADLHRLWEDRCADCHGEAGDFARKFLVVSDGKLHGRHADRDLRLFLQNHYLKNSDIGAVYDMLLGQVTSGARFKEKCSSCHAKAAQLVRESLLRRDGVLYGRDSRRPISEFLKGHGALGASEVAFFVKLLNRIEQEVHRP